MSEAEAAAVAPAVAVAVAGISQMMFQGDSSDILQPIDRIDCWSLHLKSLPNSARGQFWPENFQIIHDSSLATAKKSNSQISLMAEIRRFFTARAPFSALSLTLHIHE